MMSAQDLQLPTDGELLEKFCSAADPTAFEALMQRHGGMVYQVCRRILRDHHEAEDVTQAVFVLLSRKAKHLRRDTSVAGWLHTVARRLSLNAIRSRSRREQRENESAMNTPSSQAAHQATDHQAFRDELDAAMQKLPGRYREPLVLFHLEGCSLEQAAERLHINPSTLGTRLARGRELLRRKLAHQQVAVGSVAGLLALLSEEAKAAPMPGPIFESTKTAALQGTLSLQTQLLLDTLTLIMTTKTKLILGGVTAALLLATTGVWLKVEPSKKAPTPSTATTEPPETTILPMAQVTAPDAVVPAVQRTVQQPEPIPEAKTPLSPKSPELFSADWSREAERIANLPYGPDQLTEIRTVLGLPVSDAVYSETVSMIGYNSRKEFPFVKVLLTNWINLEPVTCMDWASTTGNPSLPGQILTQWLIKDPEAARAYAWNHVSTDMLKAADAKAEQRRPKTLEEISVFIEELDGKLDAYAEGQKPSEEERMNIYRTLGQFAIQDPVAAAAYLSPMPEAFRNLYALDKPLSDDLILTVAETWASNDPEAAILWIDSIEVGSDRRMALTAAAKTWAGVDPDAALAWAETLKNPEDRDRALTEIIPALARKHPMDYIDFSILSEDSRQSVLEEVLTERSATHPKETLDFTLRLEDAYLNHFVLPEIAENWILKEPDAAQNWAMDLPDSFVRDKSLVAMATTIAETDFHRAIELLDQVPEEVANHHLHRILGDGLAEQPVEEVLKVADRLPEVNYVDAIIIGQRMHQRSPEEIQLFIDWFLQSHQNGTISYADFGGSRWSWNPNEDGTSKFETTPTSREISQEQINERFQEVMDRMTQLQKQAQEAQ